MYSFTYSLLGSNAEGSTLNITRINREHMGTYICEANNGIGEVARQNFKVQVHCKSLSVLRTYLPTKGGEGLIKIFVVVVAPRPYCICHISRIHKCIIKMYWQKSVHTALATK